MMAALLGKVYGQGRGNMFFKDYLKTAKPEIVKNGLVLWLDGHDFLNNPASSSWRDRSGNGNSALPKNLAYTTASGADGNGEITFDGTDDYFSIPYNAVLSSNNQTIAVKLKISAIPTINKAIMFKAPDTGYDREFSLDAMANTGNIRFSVYDGVSKSSGQIQGSNICDNKMHYIVAKKEYYTNNDKLSIYIDGILSSSTNIGYNGVQNTNEIVIGRVASNGTSYTNMNLNLIQIYNRALTNTEILQNYNALR